MVKGDIPTFGSACPDCGLLHPITPGKKCLMAKEKTPSGTEIDFDSFFGALKSIVISQRYQRFKKVFGACNSKCNQVT